MADTSWFLTTRPAYPWSLYPIGLPALGVVAAVLVVVTVWTYLGTSKRRADASPSSFRCACSRSSSRC